MSSEENTKDVPETPKKRPAGDQSQIKAQDHTSLALEWPARTGLALCFTNGETDFQKEEGA